MEGLGTKLKEARLARGLTLDEAGRLTKIRPGRLEEIENEDFSQFASLAYAKGFLLIYGKFLEVDVSPYLEAFETSEHVTTDGYAYLQADAPEPEPSRPVTLRRRSNSNGGRGSLMPFVIGVVVLVVGFMVMKWILDVQRLKPRPAPAPGTSPVATATVSSTIVAPHAQPVEGTTPPAPAASPIAPTPTPTVVPAITPFVPEPSSAEPEVRRAEPVNPKDAAQIPTPTPRPSPRKSPRRVSPTPQPVASPTAPVRR
ncbi:MAG TPA: helix-turn-helix domain-containing protein [Chthoniobacterales bacterium]|nr:helix-turn-helix domain-containing protein [Chthoniobacterales bacterium]